MILSQPSQLVLYIYGRVQFNRNRVNHVYALLFRLEIDKLEIIFRRYVVSVLACEIGDDVDGSDGIGRHKVHQVICKRIVYNKIVHGHRLQLYRIIKK